MSAPWRAGLNLIITMTLCGLWHGAAWTYVLFGFIHGLWLTIERTLGFANTRGFKTRMGAVSWAVFAQLFIILSLTLFRSPTLHDAVGFLQTLSRGTFEGVKDPGLYASLAALGPIGLIHVRTLATERAWMPPLTSMEKALAAAGMLYMIGTCYGGVSDFIYFQF